MRKTLIAILIAIAIFLIFIPQFFSSSFGKPFFERALEKKFDAKIAIGSVRLSWLGPQAFDAIAFSNLDTTGTIESVESNVPLWSISEFGHAFVLKNGSFSFLKYDNLSIGQVDAKIVGHDVQGAGKASQGGRFTVNGKIYSKTDFDLVAKFSGMPSAPFDQLFKAKGLLSGSLGPSFDLSLTAVYNQGEGHIDMDLSSTNAKAALKGQIAQDSLLLNEPFTATLNFSPELSRAIGGRVLEAKNPITLRIETAGASIPLDPFAIERLEIGQATLNLGQLVCTELHPLISLFAMLKRAPIASSTALIWFTPVDISSRGGIFTIGRIDALIANTVHLCAWGSLQLPSGNLNMRLGIPADTLQQTLGIQSLSRNYVLQIPIRGTIQKPEFETNNATAKIASLVAGKQIINQLSKKAGPLGGLFNQISPQMGGEDENVPPPKRPFPWE